ncbi:Protein kinase-like domain [Pseudocohnilembus persalinus]|uniref:Protein kinase-like domain n=1 Tax=Pseudocohnilembus persalinus TaxID=266149 RepID=A0A0V0QLQ0_PSEPJ|nr:Protein kinase-like domain [Pseudocohnilembus persalinus]|eukprot:KRX03158.1 Protein kinase-like domain [Pseudocohnilembus persalinus]
MTTKQKVDLLYWPIYGRSSSEDPRPYLYYKEKPTDKVFKGYIKLGPHIRAEKNEYKGENENIYFIELIKNQQVSRKLYSKDNVVINDWFFFIRKFCVLSNFSLYYQWQEKLGSGSFSTVYKVQRKDTNGYFAAKVYYKTKLYDSHHIEKFIAMMKNEYAVLKKMEHPNIVKVHELFQEKELIIYVMDYVQHGEIYQELKKIKNFQEKDSAFIIKQLADALHVLHIENIVHRDLKLENIIVKNPENYEIKLIDFGFSEKINRQKLVSRAGTPGFLPPELFKLAPYTEKGDIFSIGVILYCLLVGTTPFKGETYKNVLENNKACKVNFQHEKLKHVSIECIECMKKLLTPNPEERYTAQEIIDCDWIQKFFPDNLEVDSELSNSEEEENYEILDKYNNGKSSIFLKSNHGSMYNSEFTEGDSFNGSQFNHLNSEAVKTLYRKSMKSISAHSKSQKNSKFSKNGKSDGQFTDYDQQFSSDEDDDIIENDEMTNLGTYFSAEKNTGKNKLKFIKNVTHKNSSQNSYISQNANSLTNENLNKIRQQTQNKFQNNNHMYQKSGENLQNNGQIIQDDQSNQNSQKQSEQFQKQNTNNFCSQNTVEIANDEHINKMMGKQLNNLKNFKAKFIPYIQQNSQAKQ